MLCTLTGNLFLYIIIFIVNISLGEHIGYTKESLAFNSLLFFICLVSSSILIFICMKSFINAQQHETILRQPQSNLYSHRAFNPHTWNLYRQCHRIRRMYAWRWSHCWNYCNRKRSVVPYLKHLFLTPGSRFYGKKGYSTKGNGRGNGLYWAEKAIHEILNLWRPATLK